MVNIPVAYGEFIVGAGSNLLCDTFIALIEREVHNIFTCSHRARHQAAFQVHHVFNRSLFARRDQAGSRSRVYRRDDIFTGNFVFVLSRKTKELHERIGNNRQKPNERFQNFDEHLH